uniref:Uncharacterized protein n=1 Tax=Arundo donax TaxID=35708 RepID=A0A0A9FS03_ARUDO
MSFSAAFHPIFLGAARALGSCSEMIGSRTRYGGGWRGMEEGAEWRRSELGRTALLGWDSEGEKHVGGVEPWLVAKGLDIPGLSPF